MALNSGAYIDCTVAGPTRKVPDMLARTRYLKVYSPAGSWLKKKLAPESRVSSYQQMPRPHRQPRHAVLRLQPRAARVAQVDVLGRVLAAQ